MMPTRAIVVLAAFAFAACTSAEETGPRTGLAPVNGGQIEYVVTGPEDGEPLLLIHGAALGTALALIQDQPALAEHRVIRMHQRGFVGSSDPVGPMSMAESVADSAADAMGLLDALGIERAHVAGHSAGGAVVLEMAAAAPERLQTVILLDPAPASGLGLADPVAEAMSPGGPLNPGGAPVDAESALAAFSSFADGGTFRELADDAPGGFAQAVADFPRVPPGGPPWWTFSRAQIEAVETPTLVVWGSQSIFVDHSKALAEALPDAEGREIAGANHALVLQAPDEVAGSIADFVGRHPM
jgi:pimeloyl-ACP methyl ester carboxylesterase